MLGHWEEQFELAQKHGWTYPQYLTILSNMEATNRQQKRIMRHIKESKLPPGKTLDAFDFKATPSVNGVGGHIGRKVAFVERYLKNQETT